MKRRRLGKSELEVSEFGFGNWITHGGGDAQERANACVRVALDEGINLFDTADVYGRGEAEVVLGRALADCAIVGSRRDEVIVATKVFFPMSDDPADRGLGQAHIRKSIDASLSRLGLDQIDLYQCHRFDDATPLEETVSVMGELCKLGKIRHWGVSMWPADKLREATEISASMGVPGPVSEQSGYNLLFRLRETEAFPTCAKLDMGVLCYSPLAQGLLTGKYRAGSAPPAGSRASDRVAGSLLVSRMTDENMAGVERLRALSERSGVSMVHLALRFCLRPKEVSVVILGASRPGQLASNIEAVQLDQELDEILDEL